MVKTNTQINKESGSTVPETTLAVVDYRMGQLEIAVKEGFAAHDKKLDSLTTNFATKEETRGLEDRVNKLEMSKGRDWIWKTLSAAAGATLAILVIYALTKK